MDTERAPPEIRERLEAQLRRLGLDRFRCTLAHDQLAKKAGIKEPDGKMVDDWLYNLSKSDAVRLSYALRQDASE